MISRDSVQTLIGGTAYSRTATRSAASAGLPRQLQRRARVGHGEDRPVRHQRDLRAARPGRAHRSDGIRVPYDKDRVKNAPNIETDRELSEQEEDQLYSYYGLGGLGHDHRHDHRPHRGLGPRPGCG